MTPETGAPDAGGDAAFEQAGHLLIEVVAKLEDALGVAAVERLHLALIDHHIVLVAHHDPGHAGHRGAQLAKRVGVIAQGLLELDQREGDAGLTDRRQQVGLAGVVAVDERLGDFEAAGQAQEGWREHVLRRGGPAPGEAGFAAQHGGLGAQAR